WAGKVDHRADIYALGVMLYEMLTGTRPHGAFDLPSTKSSVDVRLDDVVIKAMRQAPEQRYQHVSELRDAVHRIRTQANPRPATVAAPQRAPLTHTHSTGTGRRSTADILGWAAAVVVLLALAGVGAWLFSPQNKPGSTAVPHGAPGSADSAAAVSGNEQEPSPPAQPVQAPVQSPVQPPVQPPAKPAPQASPPALAQTASAGSKPAPEPAAAAPPSSPPATVTAPAPPPVIEVFTREAQNLISWAMAPLDEPLPQDIRRNLTFIREDLVDEGKARPAASLDAYREAYYLCEELLSALDSRDQARAGFGLRNAQAAANQPMSNQALDARRNYLTSWPQYSREESQRGALRQQNSANTAVASEAAKVAWNMQAKRALATLDARYRAFRAALRK
ncbi:MAG TPA: hypothetical protein VGE39_26205, partial [Prosthecobacter sp.]